MLVIFINKVNIYNIKDNNNVYYVCKEYSLIK